MQFSSNQCTEFASLCENQKKEIAKHQTTISESVVRDQRQQTIIKELQDTISTLSNTNNVANELNSKMTQELEEQTSAIATFNARMADLNAEVAKWQTMQEQTQDSLKLTKGLFEEKQAENAKLRQDFEQIQCERMTLVTSSSSSIVKTPSRYIFLSSIKAASSEMDALSELVGMEQESGWWCFGGERRWGGGEVVVGGGERLAAVRASACLCRFAAAALAQQRV